jgi:hypothetical protein
MQVHKTDFTVTGKMCDLIEKRDIQYILTADFTSQ